MNGLCVELIRRRIIRRERVNAEITLAVTGFVRRVYNIGSLFRQKVGGLDRAGLRHQWFHVLDLQDIYYFVAQLLTDTRACVCSASLLSSSLCVSILCSVFVL